MRAKDDAITFLSGALQLGVEGEFPRAVESVMADSYNSAITDVLEILASVEDHDIKSNRERIERLRKV